MNGTYAQVANTGQEQFHEEEVQSRQDQLEAQFAEQGQTLQRLDNGVHELAPRVALCSSQ